MQGKTDDWYASVPGWPYEIGPFGSRQEAVEAGSTQLDLQPGDSFETALLERWQPDTVVIDVLANLREQAGMQGTDWLGRTTLEQRVTLKGRIDAVISEWLEEVGQRLTVASYIQMHTVPSACPHEYTTMAASGPFDPVEYVGVCKHCGHVYGSDES